MILKKGLYFEDQQGDIGVIVSINQSKKLFKPRWITLNGITLKNYYENNPLFTFKWIKKILSKEETVLYLL